ncbi:MAG: GxxExxY protein [Candidatus Edwardsbacteria bacterium]|nr:GxxExxY protein [Candidatus Edwardsbacteria bacterium]MBU1575586.1 GxxExxY protein [Candidatus Edwardsbacteria bacterium]MBU2593851.1 GxxExxY protein [Candidatus Edwardsbacteria bacterium]
MNTDFTKNIVADKRDPETYAIIGAAMNVHKELGHGFLEPVYQEALAIELKKLDIPYQRESNLPVFYQGQQLNVSYRADFICFGTIILELLLRQVNSAMCHSCEGRNPGMDARFHEHDNKNVQKKGKVIHLFNCRSNKGTVQYERHRRSTGNKLSKSYRT